MDIIQIDGSMVGFAMYGYWKNEDKAGRVWLDRFLIDVNYHGPGLDTIACTYPKGMSLGFRFNGERDRNGELVMALDI